MPDYSKIASEIVDQIKNEGCPLGEAYFNDVWCIANGKLRDRSHKVYETVGERRVKDIVTYSTKALSEKLSIEDIEEMAKYYRQKYSDMVPEQVEVVDG